MSSEDSENRDCPEGLRHTIEYNIKFIFFKIMTTDINRMQQFEWLNYWYSVCLPVERRQEPALKARYQMARLVAYTCSEDDPYRALTEEEKKTKLPVDKLSMMPLVHWTQCQWEALDDMLYHIWELCKGRNSSDVWFNTKFDYFRDEIVQLHIVLSKIRSKLEQPFRETDDSGDEDEELHTKDLNEFVKFVEEETSEERFVICRSSALALVVQSETDGGQKVSRLIRRSKLGEILDNKPFSFRFFRTYLVRLFRNWSRLCKFEEMTSEGAVFEDAEGYAMNNDTGQPEAVVLPRDQPKNKRRGSTPRKRKAEAVTNSRRKTDRKDREAVELPPDPPAAVDGRKRRKRWTEEERNAVRKGVKRYGVGDWVGIKEHFSRILKERTPVNIKDCYRTMLKQGAITERDFLS